LTSLSLSQTSLELLLSLSQTSSASSSISGSLTHNTMANTKSSASSQPSSFLYFSHAQTTPLHLPLFRFFK